MKRRRLSDLYVVGTTLMVGDDQGDPVEVWLQKLNPVEHTDAIRGANAERSRQKAIAQDKESDVHQAAMSEVADFASDESLKTLALADEIAAKRMSIEAETSAKEEWADEDYLQGLFDLWLGNPAEGVKPMSEIWQDNSEDPEAKRVFEELTRFDKQVDEGVEEAIKILFADMDREDRSVLVEKAVDKYLDRLVRNKFIEEYSSYLIYMAVREPTDHSKRYFESLEEVRVLDPKVKQQIQDRLDAISVDPIEGKDSAATAASLPQSGQPAPEATEASSGLVAA